TYSAGAVRPAPSDRTCSPEITNLEVTDGAATQGQRQAEGRAQETPDAGQDSPPQVMKKREGESPPLGRGPLTTSAVVVGATPRRCLVGGRNDRATHPLATACVRARQGRRRTAALQWRGVRTDRRWGGGRRGVAGARRSPLTRVGGMCCRPRRCAADYAPAVPHAARSLSYRSSGAPSAFLLTAARGRG